MIYYQIRGQKIPLTIGGSSSGGDGSQAMGPIIDLTYKSESKHAQSGKALKQAVDQSISNLQKRLGSVLRYKGSVKSKTELESIVNKEIGDVYDVTGDADPGANYVWTGDAWDKMSENLTHLTKTAQYNTLNNQLTAHQANGDKDVKHPTQAQVDNLSKTEITSLEQATQMVNEMVKSNVTGSIIYDESTLDTALNSWKNSIMSTITKNVQNALNERFVTATSFNNYKTQFEKDKEPYLQSEEVDAIKVYDRTNTAKAPALNAREDKTFYIIGADVVVG